MLKGHFTCNGGRIAGRCKDWPGGLGQNQNSNIKWEMFTAWTDMDLKCLHGFFFFFLLLCFGAVVVVDVGFR